ncbi:hypothetical protein NMG60_11015882 [Bertholletia excelsa]
MEESPSGLGLPGFRFHPTEEELLGFYLINMISGKISHSDVICLLDIYRHEPWDLPRLAKVGEREWYFFVRRDRRHGSGGRPNRTTGTGFWKATGSDRKIVSLSEPKRTIGVKKTLVFYKGRAPRGSKTDWVMNEYRLPDSFSLPKDIVLCKIYRKATSLKELEQRAAMEEETKTIYPLESSSPMEDALFFYSIQEEDNIVSQHTAFNFKTEGDYEPSVVQNNKSEETDEGILQLPPGKDKLAAGLQLPKLGVDPIQDTFWMQPASPWIDNWTLCANVVNF